MMSRCLSENEKRQQSDALLGNAPKEIYFELYNITIQRICNLSLVVRICKSAVKFTADDRTIINYKLLELYLQ
jgi:hypothetical protein